MNNFITDYKSNGPGWDKFINLFFKVAMIFGFLYMIWHLGRYYENLQFSEKCQNVQNYIIEK